MMMYEVANILPGNWPIGPLPPMDDLLLLGKPAVARSQVKLDSGLAFHRALRSRPACAGEPTETNRYDVYIYVYCMYILLDPSMTIIEKYTIFVEANIPAHGVLSTDGGHSGPHRSTG